MMMCDMGEQREEDCGIPRDIWELARKTGVEHCLQGKVDSARRTREILIGKLEAFLRQHPENPYAWILLGDHLVGDKDKAVECYQTAVHIDPKNPEAHAELGEYFAEYTDSREEAEYHLRMALLHSEGYVIEEEVICVIEEAARACGLEEIADQALKTGIERFPESGYWEVF